MPSDTRQARLDGQLSALKRRPMTDNPYELGTSHSRAWARGYREISEERAK